MFEDIFRETIDEPELPNELPNEPNDETEDEINGFNDWNTGVPQDIWASGEDPDIWNTSD